MTAPVNTSELSPEHFSEIIAGSAINPDVAEARGYRTLYGTETDREKLTSLGFTRNIVDREETYPALLVPLWRATGEVIAHQLKPAVPRTLINGDGKSRAIKYENPTGSTNRLDVPPFTQERLTDLKVPLWVTEGMKKVDALVSQGRAAVGLTGVYNWRRKLGTLGDWEDIPLRGRDVVICFDADASENRNVQLAMRRFGAWLESKGVSRVFYLVVPKEIEGTPVKGVDDWFAAGGDLKGLQDAASLTAPADGPKDASFTDAVLAETVCEEALDGSFCWARGLGWMHWTGNVWTEVADTTPTEAVRVWVIKQFQDTLSQQKNDPSRDMSGLISGWRSVLSKGRIKALVDLARGILEKDPSHFDADPDLLGVKNGYVDLRTGTLHDPDPDKLMTRCAGADYVPGATHPLWDKALEALPEDVRTWYHDRIGQSATGYMTPDDLMVIAHGDGSNGKSTVVGAIKAALGSGASGYGVLMSDRVLLASPDSHPTELMDLRGARYAVLEETPEARRLDVHRLKRVVGTDQITARRIRQDDVTFTASHSLFVNTNFRPIVTETDHGTWRRLALLTFPYTYRRPGEPLRGPLDRAGDPRLRDPKTQGDQAFRRAVLAWIVAGARAWFERDREMRPLPDRVRADTLAWRGETDLVLGFAREMLRFVEEGTVSARDMLSAFNGWTEGQGHKPWTEKTFAARFGAHDLIKSHRVEKKRLRPAGTGKEGWGVMTWAGVTLSEGEGGTPEGPFVGQNGTPPDSNPNGGAEPKGSGDYPPQSHVSVGRVGRQTLITANQKASRETYPTYPAHPAHPSDLHGFGLRHNESSSQQPELNGHKDVGQLNTLFTEAPSNTDCDLFENGLSAPQIEPEAQRVPDPPANPASSPHGPAEGVFGLDLETRGKDWLRTPDGFVVLTGYGDRVGTDPEALVGRLRAGGTWVGHNLLGFDLPALERHHGLHVEELWGRVRDTQLQAMIADPPTSDETDVGPRFKSYSLDAVSERVLGEPKDERGKLLAAEHCTKPRCSHKKECPGWESIPASDPRYKEYCADDVNRTVRLHNALPWTPYMEREMNVQTIMARMSLNGFRVDTALLGQRIQEGEARKAQAVAELKERFGLPTERVSGKRVVQFKSPLASREGREWLKNVYTKYGVVRPPLTPKGSLATGAEVLKELADHPKCPGELKHIISLMGVVTSERTIYGTIRDNLTGDRVHVDIWPRQASGRWSAGFMTTMGKRGERSQERAVFLPEPGHSLITVDLGQIDARVIAAHAQDENYLALFAPGKDIHKEIAKLFFGSAEHRDAGKPITHSSNYGVGRNRLVSMGNDPRVVDAYLRGREENFPGLVLWTDEVREIGSSGQLLDNGFGRPLRVDPRFAYTQAPAQIGQSGTRDMMAECMLDLVKAEPRILPMLRAIVHDEIVLSVPTHEAAEVGRFVVRTFERQWAPPGKAIPVPIVADMGRPGKNWADAYGK